MRSMLWGLLLVASVAQGQGRPLDARVDSLFPSQPTNYLTDMAGIVKDPAAVNARLKEIRVADSLSLVVVTLPTIGNRAIEDVAREIGRKWLVATAGDTPGSMVRNTGGVILLVPSLRKCRVEVATGSEGYMTDGRSAAACRAAANNFRAGDFGGGFISIANTFAQYHRQELAARAPRLPGPPVQIPWTGILLALGAGVILGVVVLAQARLRKREQEQRDAEQARQEAEQVRQAAIRSEEWRVQETERKRKEAVARATATAAELKRRAALTPEQRQVEDDELACQRKERERQAAIAAEQARIANEKQQRESARLRAIEEAAEAERLARRRADEANQHSWDSSSGSSSSGSSSSDSGWSSGGSDSFSGGGGGSDY